MFNRLFNRHRIPTIMSLDIETVDLDLKPGGFVVWAEDHTSPDALADEMQNAGFLKRAFTPALFAEGARNIRRLKGRADNAEAERKRWQAKAAKAKEESKDLLARASHAIDELKRYKSGKGEQPFAVVLSPYQHSKLTCQGYFKQNKIMGVPVYIAKGVYGPVVLTEDGFNGFTRMAPELIVRKA